MIVKFSERFQTLVNQDVPRRFLKSMESRSGHLNEEDYGKPLDDYDEIFPVPEDGFIAQFCEE